MNAEINKEEVNMTNEISLSNIAKDCKSWDQLEAEVLVNLMTGKVVKFNSGGRVIKRCINDAFDDLGEEVSRAWLSSVQMGKGSSDFIELLDHKLISLSETIASHYEGKFDE